MASKPEQSGSRIKASKVSLALTALAGKGRPIEMHPKVQFKYIGPIISTNLPQGITCFKDQWNKS